MVTGVSDGCRCSLLPRGVCRRVGCVAVPRQQTLVRRWDVWLRPFSVDDVPALRAAFADPDVLAWNPGPERSEGVAAVESWLQERNDWEDGSHASWAISDPSLTLLGSVSLHKLDVEQADAEVGYWVVPWARGRGLAARAVAAAAQFGFSELRLHRLYLFHAVENQGSCRVAEVAGFGLERRLRQSYRYRDGVYHDEHLHARLASDS
jgi:RimJ/RimL family protein N-acetyltransferase